MHESFLRNERQKQLFRTQRFFQFYIKLRDVSPAIWRRLAVSNTTTLEQLHNIIQCAMGWLNLYHYHFEYKGYRFESGPHQDISYRLTDLNLQVNDKLNYVYSFIEYWEHDILIEKIIEVDALFSSPFCMDGARACPPEECGGAQGYETIVHAFKQKGDAEYDEITQWIPDDFNPELFDIDLVNQKLKGWWSNYQDNIYVVNG